MALNEPRIRPFTGGHRRAGLSDSVKCGPFRCNAWYHPPLGKNWGVCLGLKGGMKGGIEVGSVVDLASGPRSRLGKVRKKMKKKTARIPCERFSTAATRRRAAVNKKTKERKEEKYVFHCVPKTGSGECGGLFEKAALICQEL